MNKPQLKSAHRCLDWENYIYLKDDIIFRGDTRIVACTIQAHAKTWVKIFTLLQSIGMLEEFLGFLKEQK